MEERWCEIEKTLLEVFPELLHSTQWYLIFLHVTCDLCDLHPGKTWPISSGSTAAWSTANSRQKFLWLDLFIYIYTYYVLFWRSCITYKFTVLPWHHIINMINVPKEQNIDVFGGWLYLLVPSLVFNLAPQGKLPPIPRDVLQASRWRSLLFHLLGVAPSTFTTVYKNSTLSMVHLVKLI